MVITYFDEANSARPRHCLDEITENPLFFIAKISDHGRNPHCEGRTISAIDSGYKKRDSVWLRQYFRDVTPRSESVTRLTKFDPVRSSTTSIFLATLRVSLLLAQSDRLLYFVIRSLVRNTLFTNIYDLCWIYASYTGSQILKIMIFTTATTM